MRDLIMSESREFGPLAGGGWLVDESLFKFLVDFEIQKAQRLRYSVSLVCFAAEVAAIGNGESSPASVAGAITHYLRSTDAVAAAAQGWFMLLLIDAETDHLSLIVDRLARRLETLSWSAGGSCYPRTAARPEDMLHQAVDLLSRAKQAGGNRIHIPV